MNSIQRWTMLAAILGSGIVFLDGTVVNVALPKIGQQLPASVMGVLEGQTYINSGYLATLAALLILAGALADYYGRRRVFAIGLAGFGATSILCGLAPTLELLVLFRILQGAAGALLVPGSLSIITATFEGPQRSRAFGLWASATSALVLLGPITGGFLVDTISWRTAFLINIPLVVIALYATLRYMKETRDEEASGRFDWLGAIVVAIAVGGLTFGAVRGQQKQWQDGVAFVALGLGAVCAVAFPFLMTRPAPLVPLSLFKRREFAVINLSTLLIYGALYVTLAFQGVFIQGTLGYTAFAAGATGLPTGILLTFLSARVGAVAGRIGVRPFLIAGPVLMAIGLLWLARIPATSTPWAADLSHPSSLVPSSGYLVDVLPAILLFGIGISLVVAPLTTALMASVPVRQSGLGSAINNAVSRVGQPLVSAVIFIAITASFYSTLAQRAPGLDTSSAQVRQDIPPLNRPDSTLPRATIEAVKETSTDAFHLAMLVSAALLFSGAAVNAVGLREPKTAQTPAPVRETAEGAEAPTMGGSRAD